MSKQELSRPGLTPEHLINHSSVRDVLGLVINICAPDSQELLQQVEKYVDSKEKAGGAGRTGPEVMEFWPLVKVVKIFTKSEVLRTGLVLVDLVS